MIADTSQESNVQWILCEWELLQWQLRRDEQALKELFGRLFGLGYELLLLMPTNQPLELQRLEGSISRFVPPQQPLPMLVVEQPVPNTRFKLDIKPSEETFTQVVIQCAQSSPNNVVMGCQQLLKRNSMKKDQLTLLFKTYELAYWFKFGSFRSFYFSKDEEIFEVLELIIINHGVNIDETVSIEKSEDEEVEPDYSLKPLDVSQLTKEPLDALEYNGVYRSKWFLKNPQNGSSYRLQASVYFYDKKVDPRPCREDVMGYTVTAWLYQLVGVNTTKFFIASMPVNPKIPLDQIAQVKPKQPSLQYKSIEHVAVEEPIDSIPFSRCVQFANNLNDSAMLKTGLVTIDGVQYTPNELGRIISIAYVLGDLQFFDFIGEKLRFRVEGGMALALKGPTSLDYKRINQLNTKEKSDATRKVGTDKCWFDLLSMPTELKESFYIGLSCLKAAYYSDVYIREEVVQLYKEQASVYNKMLETRLRLMNTYLQEFLKEMGEPTFPLEKNQFNLKPLLYVESEPFHYENIVKLKERVILMHAVEDEMLDQVLSETARMFMLDGMKVEMLECRGKSDEQVKQEMEKHRAGFTAGKCIVLVRNFHRLEHQYKMNMIYECGLSELAGARLLITCPTHYLIRNYQSWFQPHPNSPDSFIEIRIGGVVKEQLGKNIGHFVEEPLKYMDLIYEDSCLVDLICSPTIFSRFYKLIAPMKLEERIYRGFELFRLMINNWMTELKRRGLYRSIEKQLLSILRELSLNYVIRGKRIARLPSFDLWELLNRSNHIGLVRMEEHNGISFIRNKFAYFYVVQIILEEVWKAESTFVQISELMRFPIIRKILKEVVTEDEKKKLIQKITRSKHDCYFHKPSNSCGIAISILHACGYDLTNRDFSLTQLQHASLHGCNLSNTKLRGANLSAADMTRSYCLNTQLDMTRVKVRCKTSEVEFIGMKSVITDVAVVDDNMLLVNTSGLVEKVEWGDMEPLVSYNLPTGEVRMMRATPGFVVTVREANIIEVYDLENGNKLKEFDTTVTYIEYLTLIQSYAVLGRRSVDLELWDYYKAVKVKHIVWKAIVSSVVAFGNRNLLIGDERGVVSSLVVPDNSIEFNFKAHDSEIHCLHGEEQRIITAAEDRTIKVWRRAMGRVHLFKEILSVEPIRGLFASHVNDFFAVTGTNSATLLTKNLQHYGRFYKPGCTVHSACIDQKLNRLYLCTNQGLNMFEYKTLHQQQEGHSCSVTVCIIDDYFNRLITGSLDTNILVWNMLTNKLERKLYGHTEGVTCLRMTGYDVIVSGSNDFTIRLWNIKEGKCLMTITDHLAKLQDLTFNNRTKVLFSGSADGEVKVWKLSKLETSLKWMKTFQQHRKAVRKLACDQQTSLYVSCGEDYNVIIYGEDVKYCQTLLKNIVNSLIVIGDNKCVCYCMDGSFVVIDMIKGNVLSQHKLLAGLFVYSYVPETKLFVSLHGNCIVLHTQDKVLQKVPAHCQPFNYLDYNPYTKTIVTAGNDCCLGVWQHDPNKNTIKLKRFLSGESLMHSIVQS